MSTTKKTASDTTSLITLSSAPPPAVADMIYAALSAEPHIDPAETLSEFGQLKVLMAKYDEAESLYRAALSIALRAAGPDHALFKLTIKRLAGPLRMTGRPDQADELEHPAAETQDTSSKNSNPPN